MTIPNHVKNRLKNIDPGLRIRWSYERRKWVLEHKSPTRDALFKPVRIESLPDGQIREHRLPELSDRYIQYRDCYYPVAYLRKIDERIFEYLHNADMAGKDLAKHVEQVEAKEAAIKARERNNEMESVASEAFSNLKFRERRG
jgi:hypothetical protein